MRPGGTQTKRGAAVRMRRRLGLAPRAYALLSCSLVLVIAGVSAYGMTVPSMMQAHAAREPRDVQAIERTGSYHGLYHVLGGVISPMDKIGPEQLHIRELLARLGHEDIHEVIIATNPNIEGETTASYLARTIKPLGVEVSRLASGLPVGGDLEYADELTLGRAIEARRAI